MSKQFEETGRELLENSYDVGHDHCTEEYCDSYWKAPKDLERLIAASQADQVKLLEEIYDVLKAYDKVGTGLPGEVMHVVEHKLAALKKEAK